MSSGEERERLDRPQRSPALCSLTFAVLVTRPPRACMSVFILLQRHHLSRTQRHAGRDGVRRSKGSVRA